MADDNIFRSESDLIGELASEFADAGWGDVDLEDAENVLADALDYMDEQGYM